VDLKQLEYFRHVAELGSFTRAASFLSVVQPALSRQVRQLEVELGQNLFERNGRGVVLTDAGARLLEHTRGILTQVGAHGRSWRTNATATRDTLRSGCPQSRQQRYGSAGESVRSKSSQRAPGDRRRIVGLHPGMAERRPGRLRFGL